MSKDRKLAQIFNSSFRSIDDVLSLNNTRFGEAYYLHSNVCFLHWPWNRQWRKKQNSTANVMTSLFQ